MGIVERKAEGRSSLTMSVDERMEELRSGQVALLDVRTASAYSRGHVPGSVSAPYSRQGWGPAVARWVSQGQTGVALFADNKVVGDAAAAALVEQGLQPAWVWDSGPDAWRDDGGAIVAIKNITVDKLHQDRSDYVVVDVREPYEWRTGIVPGALKIPLGELPQHLDQFAADKEYVVICAHGNRSQTGAAFLADQGLSAASVAGGMALWMSAGHPVDKE